MSYDTTVVALHTVYITGGACARPGYIARTVDVIVIHTIESSNHHCSVAQRGIKDAVNTLNEFEQSVMRSCASGRWRKPSPSSESSSSICPVNSCALKRTMQRGCCAGRGMGARDRLVSWQGEGPSCQGDKLCERNDRGNVKVELTFLVFWAGIYDLSPFRHIKITKNGVYCRVQTK